MFFARMCVPQSNGRGGQCRFLRHGIDPARESLALLDLVITQVHEPMPAQITTYHHETSSGSAAPHTGVENIQASGLFLLLCEFFVCGFDTPAPQRGCGAGMAHSPLGAF